MSKILPLLLTILICLMPATALAEEYDYKQELTAARQFQAALKKHDKAAVAKMINYPMGREIPLPTISTAADFINNWDDFFDDAEAADLIAATPEPMGWRGVMLRSGDVWFDGDKLVAINTRTAAFEKKLSAAQVKDEARLHPHARGYTRTEVECDTAQQHIRVQSHGDNYYLFAWKHGAPLTDEPEMELAGTLDLQGSVGNAFYVFEKAPYIYEVDDSHYCEDVCQTSLNVYKETRDSEPISSQVCQ